MSISPGDIAPDFTLPQTDGRSVSLDALADARAIAVVFWCNHCPYVKAWTDRMNDLAEQMAERGLVVVAINSNDARRYPEDSFDQMIERVRDTGTAFRYAHDATQEIARAYGAERTPEVFLLDSERRLRYHGAIDDCTEPAGVTAHWLRDAVEAVIAGRQPDPFETEAVGCTIKWCA